MILILFMANAFNNQFYTFVTDENDNIPSLDTSIYSDCDQITFTVEGIETYSNN